MSKSMTSASLAFAAICGLMVGCSSSQVPGEQSPPPPAIATPPAPECTGDCMNPKSFNFVKEVGADRVFFDVDQSSLKPESDVKLNKWAAFLKSHTKSEMLLEGHADERGTREYNLALGERRVQAVKAYLVAQGIDASRISSVSYGKERPAILGSNESAWAQNRRVVYVPR